jgi:hypothetical protein
MMIARSIVLIIIESNLPFKNEIINQYAKKQLNSDIWHYIIYISMKI